MKQRSKLFSLLLALCMVVTLLPAAAFAQETIAGESPAEAQGVAPAALSAGVAVQAATTRTSTLDLTSESTASNDTEGWKWENNTLTLTNCTINTTEGNGIVFPDGADVTLVLNGENHIVAAGQTAISGCKSLTISGDGSLTTQATNTHISCQNLTLTGGSVTLDSAKGYMGINATNLTVNSGTLSAVGFSHLAINVTGTITINGGHVTVSGGQSISGIDINNINIEAGMIIRGGDSADSLNTIESITSPVPKYLDISATSTPVTPSATFTDGFGTPIAKDNASSYVKGTTPHPSKTDYTFAGWVDENGDALDSFDSATPGATYTAKWTKNNKTVRTTPLIFTTGTEWQTGCTTSGTLWTNDAEGWSWDTQSKTLTLFGATIDVNGDFESNAAITLPDGATIKTEAGTENTVERQGVSGIAVLGSLTIEGSGSLSVTGTSGIYSKGGNMAINAPLTAKATGSASGPEYCAALCGGSGTTITYDTTALKLEKPANWGTGTGNAKIFVGTGSTPATEVVLALKPATITDLALTPTTASVEKGKTQQFKVTMTITPAGVTPTLTWSVSGNVSNNTKIDQTGLLTVGADETARTLTVTVSASVGGGEAVAAEATVTVTAPSTAPKYYYKGTGTTSSNTPAKSPKTADAGIALYAGMAVASLLGSGVVLNRKRKNF